LSPDLPVIDPPKAIALDALGSKRALSADLAGYLCGTRSSLVGREKRIGPRVISQSHKHLDSAGGTPWIVLGTHKWDPRWPADELHAQLTRALDVPGVVDLLVFGSACHDQMTGFSDLDAILVMEDRVADSEHSLEALRPRVLEAQRAVLAYQPMQHHAFLVATPRLLGHGLTILDLPAQALTGCSSLLGREVLASAGEELGAAESAIRIMRRLAGVGRWPTRAWETHLTISLFELLPALYCQAQGHDVEKRESYAACREEFGGNWWPYDVLAEVRVRWPRLESSSLKALMTITRNPWLAHAIWRRSPVPRVPGAVGMLLTKDLLAGLRTLASEMQTDLEQWGV
jgi:hypothetical protein